MGIFDRFSRLVRSNINDLISSAEDPEKMLNTLITDMNDQLIKAKQQVAVAIADERKLRDQFEKERQQSAEWEAKAELAVRSDRDDLAKQALLRQQEYHERTEAYFAEWQAQLAQTEQLKVQLRDLADKIEEAKRKRNLLLAKQRRAEAQRRIQQTMSSLSEKSAFEAFARMEEKIETNVRMIAAEATIDAEFTGDKLDSEFKQLARGAGGSDADTRLLALKQKMGMLPAAAPSADRQLAAGAGSAAARPALGAGGQSSDRQGAPVPPVGAQQQQQPPAAPGKGANQTTEAELLAEFEELSQGRSKG
ncbi:MAG: PspA/IM30 family protein [Gemmatirosa sp.]